MDIYLGKKGNMRRALYLAIILYLSPLNIFSQEFIPIWDDGKMPNSKGLSIIDSISNERVYHVGIPGVYAFEPSIAENQHVAVLIIPGGGYVRLAYQISGIQLAKWFNTFGVTAFVLNHRLPSSLDLVEGYKAPVQDAQQAMRFIRTNAGKWDIDVNKIGAMGSSAGGHVAACLSNIQEDWSGIQDIKGEINHIPDFTILVSPVITMNEFTHGGSRNNLLGANSSQELRDVFSCELNVSGKTPPAFIVHASDDNVVPPMNSILYYVALQKKNVKMSALHIYTGGGHNIALRNNPGTTNTWTELCEKWLSEIGILNHY